MINKIDDLMLLPEPKKIIFTNGTANLNSLPVQKLIAPEKVSDKNPEAYRLEISQNLVAIFANTQTGLFWGEKTLEQLKKHNSVPCLEIDDAPLFSNRGVMLDISRDRVPTMKTLFELIDILSSLKINHLQLYVEHTIAYKGHEDVWKNSDPITLEELSALDHYCKSRGISLNANQNSLGHFERWLKHPKYASLGESERIQKIKTPYGSWVLKPNTLNPSDPRTLSLLEDILSQLLPLCSGEYANIGCDEPWDLGFGKSKELCEKTGKTKVFSKHLEAVCEIVRKFNKRPQFWCDPHPNEDQKLSKDIIALVWGYEYDSDFHARAEAHISAGREVWVAPGTSCWNSCTGRTWNRRGNLNNAAKETSAKGFLCTAWGDGGHRQQFPITLFGFADAASAAWSGADKYNNKAAGLHLFNSTELGDWLAELGNLDAELTQGHRNAWNSQASRQYNINALWVELSSNILAKNGVGDLNAWEEIKSRIEKLEKTFPKNISPLLGRECKWSLQLASWITEKAILKRTGRIESATGELSEKMTDIVAEYRDLWLARSRYGGLEDSLQTFSQHLYI